MRASIGDYKRRFGPGGDAARRIGKHSVPSLAVEMGDIFAVYRYVQRLVVVGRAMLFVDIAYPEIVVLGVGIWPVRPFVAALRQPEPGIQVVARANIIENYVVDALQEYGIVVPCRQVGHSDAPDGRFRINRNERRAVTQIVHKTVGIGLSAPGADSGKPIVVSLDVDFSA